MKNMHEKYLNKITANKILLLYGLPILVYLLLTTLIMTYGINHTNEQYSVSNLKNTMNYKILTNEELNIINTWHMFGLNNNTMLNKVQDNNVALIGIIYRGENSNAVLLINSKEFVFKTGDVINSVYTIHKIEPSRIIVATQDGLQEIELFQNLNQKVIAQNIEDQNSQVLNNYNDNQNMVQSVEMNQPFNGEEQNQEQANLNEQFKGMQRPYGRFKNY